MSEARKHRDKAPDVLKELKKGTWLQNARARKQYQKSPWNTVIQIVGLPLWLGSAYGLAALAVLLRNRLHPNHIGPALTHTSGFAEAIIIFAPWLAGIFIGMIGANFLVYQIPSARRALDKEGEKMPSISYAVSQRSLLKIGAPVIFVSFALLITAAVIG